MRLFGLTIARTSTLTPVSSGRGSGGWYPIVREPYTGAWQRNEELRWDAALSYFAVFACTTLIASDIGKLRLRLVAEDDDGIWSETTSPAFSPVLRRPNRYQNIIKFIEQWIVSKLVHGNTYVLKERDDRGVVRALYILDPTRVTPLVAPDGSVYYQLSRDDLSGVPETSVAVPASEIIHDLMVALFHRLIGVSPIFACAVAAQQGLAIQQNSTAFFANGSSPGGVILVPGDITQEQADRIYANWVTKYTGSNAGKVAILSGNMKYEAQTVNAVDAQLIDQLKWTAETVCSCYHVPPFMIGVGPYPPYANSEPLLQLYYSQCLQTQIICIEKCLDEGLELPTPYGTEFDPDDLIWLDTATKTKAAGEGISSGALSPDEARKKYYGLPPVPGGQTPYLQQQYFSLAALAERDAEQPFAKPAPPPAATQTNDEDEEKDEEKDLLASVAVALLKKDWSQVGAA